MSHSDALKQLFPIKLEGVFDEDIELEGKHLDEVEGRAQDLLTEMFGDTTDELITDWERVYDLDGEGKTMQARRNAIVTKIREIGGLSIQYFINLASSLGYSITIEELSPPKAGIAKAGVAKVWPDAIRFVWQVNIIPGAGGRLVYAKAGIAKAGDRILWKDLDVTIKEYIERLKPAHTYVTFP